MTLFTQQIDYDLNTLSDQPRQQSTFLQENLYENDIYEFDTASTNNLNLSLNNLATDDDADLYLYEDSNGNGILDSSDLELASSLNLGGEDDAINYRAEAGTYFARVHYYSGGDDGRIDYDLDLSADITGQGSSTIAVDHDYGYSLYGEAAATETGYISDYNTSDTYAVSVIDGEQIEITLSGLTSDADLRVIEDLNENNIVDAGEVYTSSVYGGITDDTISITEEGDYFVEVYQYSGSTDYTLQFDQEFV